MNQYKVVKSEGVDEFVSASITANKAGRHYAVNALLEVERTQDNAPGVIWGQLANGNWVQIIWNGKTFCQFVKVLSDPIPPPPVPDPTPDPVPVNTTLSIYVEIDEVTKAWTYAAINGVEVIVKPTPLTAG